MTETLNSFNGYKYLRRWLPELLAVPDKYIHAPWEMPGLVQAQTGCRIGQDYPSPIINHAVARQRTLDAYAQAREIGAKSARRDV